jgi:hypothetical protein
MRFNPDTERGLSLEAHVEESRRILKNLPKPKPAPFVWDCTHGRGWILNPELTPVQV